MIKPYAFLAIPLTLILGLHSASAQSAIGSWIKTSDILTYADGKTVNSFEKLKKAVPCLASIVYTFSAGGQLSEDASACPANIRKTAAAVDRQSSWKMSGEKVTLQISGNAAPMTHAMFHIRFSGNDRMVWTFLYAENPDTPNPFKAKEMVTTYERKR